MPVRRSLGGPTPGYGAGGAMGMSGGSQMPPGMGGSAMAPRPGMTGAPANNPAPGMPGPQSGMTGVAVPPPAPLQPGAGGPTAPSNVGPMLMNQQGQQPGAPAPRLPLMPWGGQGGNTGKPADTFMGGGSGIPGDSSSDMTGGSMTGAGGGGQQPGQAPGSMNPMMLLKLLKASGRI